jgi:hypothetical protein
VANSQDDVIPSQHPDLLAAVVLHTLVTEGRRESIAVSQIAVTCERDPDNPAELHEVEAALEILLDDGLARREGERFRPTRAAVRAGELSF